MSRRQSVCDAHGTEKVYYERSQNWRCQACNTEARRRFYRAHTERMKQLARKHSLKSRYNLTVEQYEEMLGAQDGGCATCAVLSDQRHLDVDHDHETGRVRGLLCSSCNRAIGFAQNNPVLLRGMADYLECA